MTTTQATIEAPVAFSLRLPRELYAALRAQAQREGKSINLLMLDILRAAADEANS
jgi:predicted HicB family RNase H-like nuclease